MLAFPLDLTTDRYAKPWEETGEAENEALLRIPFLGSTMAVVRAP